MSSLPWLALPFTLIPTVTCIAQTPPPIQLAESYQSQSISGYWASEKFDGVRAYWDGHQLLTRSGNLIHAPTWFTRRFPKHPMDGELWIERGQFDAISALVRSEASHSRRWKQVKFMVFDWPERMLIFADRYHALGQQIKERNLPHLRQVAMWPAPSIQRLRKTLKQISQEGAEGIVLHRAFGLYQPGRNTNQLKLKPYQDGEARVVGYSPGQGKYQNMVGALVVETSQGIRFKLGSGLSDADRREPPPIGSQITYRYNGMTKNGKPRFARFLRRFDPI